MQNPRVDLAQALGRYGDIDASVYTQQIDNLALRKTDLLAHVLVAGAAVASLGRLYPLWVAMLWVGGLGLALWGRAQLHRRYRSASVDRRADPRWGHWFTVGALATGMVWGLLASAFVVTRDLLLQMVALALIGGMAVGSIARNAASTPVMVALVGPMLAMSAAALLVHPDSFHIAVAVMLTAFGIVLVTSGRSLHQTVNADLRQTIELVKTGTTLANAQDVASIGGWEVEAATRRVVCSGAMLRILGIEPATEPSSIDMILDRVHPDDRDRVEVALSDWLSFKSDLSLDHRLRPIEGVVRWIHQFGLLQQGADGRPARHIAMVQDITERKRAEESLQFANVIMKTQMEAAESGILVVNTNHEIISFNDRFVEITGCPRLLLESGDYDGVIKHVIVCVKEPEKYLRRIRFFNENPGEDGYDEIEIAGPRFIHQYTVTLKGPAGDYLGRGWFLRDVTDHRLALAEAVMTSRLDPLTGLANRGAFVEALRETVIRAARDAAPFAVLYIDLDHFKDVNDALGHLGGDELLRAVARRLTAGSRPADTVARLGGDEFAVIAADLDPADDASELAARLVAAVSEPYVVNGVPVRISASIGVAPYTPGSTDAETLLSHADLALYDAKAGGRAEHRAFTATMAAEARNRNALGAELDDAIAQDQLFLLYQPQIELCSGRIVGVEALVRWRHPRRGVLDPDQFMPVAERTGAIVKLGRWALATACREARTWIDAGAPALRLAVKVSALQFKTPLAFEADIEAALAASGLPPETLELELTEAVLMSTFGKHAHALSGLRSRGVTIAIDDFGAGPSSLDCFRRYPADRLKIGPTLVRNVEAGGRDAAIVEAAIGLACAVGLEVIADGVEHRSQLERLQSWGCAQAQGSYFARPLPPGRIAPLANAGFRPSFAPAPALRYGGQPPGAAQAQRREGLRAAG